MRFVFLFAAGVAGAAACSSSSSDASSSGAVPGQDAAVSDGAGPALDGNASSSSGGPDAALTDARPGTDAAPPKLGPPVAFASGYGPDLAVFSVDPSTGALAAKSKLAAVDKSPSFLAVRPGATHLYAVGELTVGRVGAYAIDRATGALTYLNSASSQGNGPAFVAVDATGKWVMVANYGDGTVAVLPVQSDGSLGAATDSRSVGANAHMIVADPSNKFVFVPCLGADYVAQFTFDAVAGKLTPNAVAHVTTAAGAGPRHLAFHPGGTHAYLVNEKASTITSFDLDVATGRLTGTGTQTTLPAGFSGANTGAEVLVHPSGSFVYASNRGDDSIAVFGVDAAGKLTLKSHTKTGGTTPRSFGLDVSGAFLYAANQGSGTLTAFTVDPAQGTLTRAGAAVNVPSATFVGVVRLPAP